MKRSKTKKTRTNHKRTKKEIISTVSPIAVFVRTRREELGYTQEELAFRAGISAGFLKAFERGKQTVRLDKVTELLEYFGVSLIVKMKKGENGEPR